MHAYVYTRHRQLTYWCSFDVLMTLSCVGNNHERETDTKSECISPNPSQIHSFASCRRRMMWWWENLMVWASEWACLRWLGGWQDRGLLPNESPIVSKSSPACIGLSQSAGHPAISNRPDQKPTTFIFFTTTSVCRSTFRGGCRPQGKGLFTKRLCHNTSDWEVRVETAQPKPKGASFTHQHVSSKQGLLISIAHCRHSGPQCASLKSYSRIKNIENTE